MSEAPPPRKGNATSADNSPQMKGASECRCATDRLDGSRRRRLLTGQSQGSQEQPPATAPPMLGRHSSRQLCERNADRKIGQCLPPKSHCSVAPSGQEDNGVLRLSRSYLGRHHKADLLSITPLASSRPDVASFGLKPAAATPQPSCLAPLLRDPGPDSTKCGASSSKLDPMPSKIGPMLARSNATAPPAVTTEAGAIGCAWANGRTRENGRPPLLLQCSVGARVALGNVMGMARGDFYRMSMMGIAPCWPAIRQARKLARKWAATDAGQCLHNRSGGYLSPKFGASVLRRE